MAQDALAEEVSRLRTYLLVAAWICAISLGMNCAQAVALIARANPAAAPAVLTPLNLPTVEAPEEQSPVAAAAPVTTADLVVDINVPRAVVNLIPVGKPPMPLVGSFPRHLRLEPGSYVLSAGRVGYRSFSRQLVLQAGAKERVAIELRPRYAPTF